MFATVIGLALVGLALSSYGFFIEKKLKQNSSYKPLCDISDTISCSKPLLSPYAQLISIPNALLGIIYYVGLIIVAFFGYEKLLFMLTCAGVVMSVVFAYLLYFKIRTICLLCTAIYLVNGALFFAAYKTLI